MGAPSNLSTHTHTCTDVSKLYPSANKSRKRKWLFSYEGEKQKSISSAAIPSRGKHNTANLSPKNRFMRRRRWIEGRWGCCLCFQWSSRPSLPPYGESISDCVTLGRGGEAECIPPEGVDASKSRARKSATRWSCDPPRELSEQTLAEHDNNSYELTSPSADGECESPPKPFKFCL